ncbi:MAG: DUF47 family protein [Candidatus Altiarchaeales archaeon]|nr:DUF47 family protein [Candidatus Altiarchaeales archaeon]MBD3417155.1 DUF47 family protein [Candidatus Altiarchaeales archaeon]
MVETPDSYTPWLIRKSEREFIVLALTYLDEITDHANLLAEEVKCVTGGDFNGCTVSHDLLNNRSREAVKTRRQLIRTLQNASITPENRGYLTRMVFSIGDISSYIGSASARLTLREVAFSEDMAKGVKDMMDKTMLMMSLLKESIRLLTEDLEESLVKTNEIEDLEEDIDDIRRGLLKEILNDPAYTDPAVIQVLVEIIGSVETISDKVAAAANNIEATALTHLP